MRPSSIDSSTVTVLGAARSGRAVARLLADAGAKVFLSDMSEDHHHVAMALEEEGIRAEFGGHSDRALQADFVAVSPGVPSNSPIMKRIRHANIPAYSELEVASWFWDHPIIAITGTNGKTTTTSLLGHIFSTAGRRPLVAGNIGKAFSEGISSGGAYDLAVLEVSSFQLDHIDTFRPDVSVILNITPDHLDRYENSFEQYTNSKFRIFENQTEHDSLVYNHDDEQALRGADRARKSSSVRTAAFSHKQEVERGAFIRNDAIILRNDEDIELMRTTTLSLRGKHNTGNALAAAIAARVMEVPVEEVRHSLSSFEGVPHRLEVVREVNGVQYVNDSKATNVNAVWYALESYHEPVILIAGGRDKGNDYEQLKPLVRKSARAVLAIGESADKVHRELGAEAPHAEITASLESAVERASEIAQPGDVVLLSPACASFDMFSNFEERGDAFRRAVMNI